MLRFEAVSKKYSGTDFYALNSIDLAIKDGSILGMVGLNGAGKTTAIKIASGVLTPTEGTVFVDGVDLNSRRSAAIRKVGWVPENDNFDPHYSAIDLMRYYCGLFGLSSDEAKTRSHILLDQVGLGKSKTRRLNTFSHGMRKRFMVAAALIANPRNLLLDESYTGLDPEGTRFLSRIILDAKRDGRSVLVSSHILTELSDLADRIAVVHRGKIIRILDKSEVSGEIPRLVRVRVDRPEKRIGRILKDYGDVSIQDEMIVIFNPSVNEKELYKISEKLGEEGFNVIECKLVSEKLEDQFFRIIGEADNRSLDA